MARFTLQYSCEVFPFGSKDVDVFLSCNTFRRKILLANAECSSEMLVLTGLRHSFPEDEYRQFSSYLEKLFRSSLMYPLQQTS